MIARIVGGRTREGLLCTVLMCVLGGCEAPLVLDGVENMRSKPIQRTDRYQSAARFADNVVVVGNQGVVVYSPDKGGSWQRHCQSKSA